jgi:hypothetical protein
LARVEIARGLIPWLMAGAGAAEPEVVHLLERPEWQKRAACRGSAVAAGESDHFSSHTGHRNRAIKQCWNECPVRSDCLFYALEQEEELDGIWGGYGKSERVEFRRRRTPAA